jgi:hypothetical protein
MQSAQQHRESQGRLAARPEFNETQTLPEKQKGTFLRTSLAACWPLNGA